MHALAATPDACGKRLPAESPATALGRATFQNERKILNSLRPIQQLLRNGHAQQALNRLSTLRKDSPWNDELEYLSGLCHQALGLHAQAVECFAKLIEHSTSHHAGYVQLAYTMAKIGHVQQARMFIEQALHLFPEQAELVHAKAQLLAQEGLYLQACQAFEQLHTLDGDRLEYLFEHAQLLQRTQQNEQALGLYEKILATSPNHLAAMNNMANVLCCLGQQEAALKVYDRLLQQRPNDVMALKNLATIHLMRRDFVRAHACYQRAYRLEPNEGDIVGAYWYALSFICDWRDHDKVLKQLLADTRYEQARPLTACLFSDDPARLLGHAQHQAKTQFKPTGVLGPLAPRAANPRIRLAYYSSDFYTHATVMLIRGLIAAHDRERFEVHAFSLQPTRQDEGHFKIRALFDHFHEVHALSDRAVAMLSRQLEIDIAIDLKGYTEGCRPQIFAERAAPLQVNFLGYPGTMGAPFMDAIVADPYVIPEGQELHYTERVLRMPHCYQPNDPYRPKPTGDSLRPAELPAGAFVFCCFNNSHKITPETFRSWMRILRQTPGSVLWLLKTNDAARDNLWAEAGKAGICKDRLIFAPFLPEDQHLERLSHADLFLDTFPYNAHTSASDAVWAGVPVLTRSGQSFASRVAGSILTAAGAAELICATQEEYETLAVQLHADELRLVSIRQRLRQGLEQGPLYQADLFAKNLEKLLETQLTVALTSTH